MKTSKVLMLLISIILISCTEKVNFTPTEFNDGINYSKLEPDALIPSDESNIWKYWVYRGNLDIYSNNPSGLESYKVMSSSEKWQDSDSLVKTLNFTGIPDIYIDLTKKRFGYKSQGNNFISISYKFSLTEYTENVYIRNKVPDKKYFTQFTSNNKSYYFIFTPGVGIVYYKCIDSKNSKNNFQLLLNDYSIK
ncbi:MAG TPA: hypothetical protein PK762_05260 [Candidatus Kapabacteria bacterium]|nr:hypothetical protein [Candidatus Kapabacteria bacterium]